MKKNDWILLTATALYSFLFYLQSAGINFILFNIALISLIIFKKNNLIENRNWWLAVTGCLCSSFCIAWYGNTLSVIANLISLSILSGLSFNTHSSVILSFLFSCYSYACAPFVMFLEWVEPIKKNVNPERDKQFKRICLVGIPLLITLVFFFMYRASNPLFNELAKKINLDFISWNWIVFTLSGFILAYGFFHHKVINALSKLDENASDHLDSNNVTEIKLFGKRLDIQDENYSGIVLFILLNILLLIVNILDLNFLFFGGKLPKGLTYSEFVHQGTGMLITSIIFAIAIILFYFRGSLNFYKKNRTIKMLAYFWIIQNVFMLISTALRNDLYVIEYGLTYKRIGVYIYLILSGLGLLTTFVKIMKLKSNNYLFRINGWFFYAVLIVLCFFNWDAIICNFNIFNAKQFDKNYLCELSDTNLPELFVLSQDTSFVRKEFTTLNVTNDSQNYRLNQKINFDLLLCRKLYYFFENWDKQDWKSWKYNDAKVHSSMLVLNADKKIISLMLNGTNIKTLEPFREFKNISEIYLVSNQIRNINELFYFPELHRVDLSNNNIHSIHGIEKLDHLVYLNLTRNYIEDFTPLFELKNLKELYVPTSINDFQYQELLEKLPNTKIFKT